MRAYNLVKYVNYNTHTHRKAVGTALAPRQDHGPGKYTFVMLDPR